mmetsp:Transcript_27297/g.90748  ORF Transcript_27297/g.90748 Transcript_27297/m.90748 type:complete len:254 (+) Transcript_27297:1289-2050(+)
MSSADMACWIAVKKRKGSRISARRAACRSTRRAMAALNRGSGSGLLHLMIQVHREFHIIPQAAYSLVASSECRVVPELLLLLLGLLPSSSGMRANSCKRPPSVAIFFSTWRGKRLPTSRRSALVSLVCRRESRLSNESSSDSNDMSVARSIILHSFDLLFILPAARGVGSAVKDTTGSAPLTHLWPAPFGISAVLGLFASLCSSSSLRSGTCPFLATRPRSVSFDVRCRTTGGCPGSSAPPPPLSAAGRLEGD